MISKDFYTFVSGRAGITALTSSIYPQFLPQQHPGFPALTFALDDDQDQQLLDGSVGGMREALMVVDCWDGSYITAHALADAVKLELIGYVGAFGASTVDRIRKEREIELYEADTELHRVALQFFIAYT
jgi:hypothetical protein